MPGQTVHLEIGLRLLAEFGDETQADEMFLGCISPDAIHMRDGWTSRLKRFVHLAKERPEGIGVRMARLDDLWKRERDAGGYGFVWGWISHALADHLWWHLIGAWYWRTLRGTESDEELRRRWYDDALVAERELARYMQGRDQALAQLAAASPRGMRDYVTTDEVSRWRDAVLERQQFDPRSGTRTPRYFTKPRMDEFLRIVVATMKEASMNGFRNAAQSVEAHYPEDFVALTF